jgi:hypothetical protein
MGNDHEVKFHEIEIGGGIISLSQHQQNFAFFMSLKFLIMIRSPDCANFHEIKIC